ncbi:MAG TPA: helix-turn-helix domain-containing protein [Solirubrobacteraceae bacterium]|nr:helix-turn-helix domain-containing protein [Solirubrobacteraceae bacterium]
MSDLVNPHERLRVELVERVRARRSEVEQAVFARVRDSAVGLQGPDDPEYLAGLRGAIAAGIELALQSIETGELEVTAIPQQAVAQAQRAARTGVSLDAVVRRYVLGSTVLGDFLLQESEHPDFMGGGGVLRQALRAQAAVLERLIAAVNAAYALELERTGRSPERRRTECVLRMLAGGGGDAAELGYELATRHVGVIATGPGASEALAEAARSTGSALLCVRRGEQTVWGWLGKRELSARDVERALDSGAACQLSFALGEPSAGLEGWRLTHQQAQAALRVALQDPRTVTRYADVALLASVLRDEGLSRSLIEIYLAPLGERTNGGAVLRETLRAYFAAERNASSAASALGVTRHTVENRLRTIEERLGQSLRTRQAELEVALRLEEMGEPGEPAPTGAVTASR